MVKVQILEKKIVLKQKYSKLNLSILNAFIQRRCMMYYRRIFMAVGFLLFSSEVFSNPKIECNKRTAERKKMWKTTIGEPWKRCITCDFIVEDALEQLVSEHKNSKVREARNRGPGKEGYHLEAAADSMKQFREKTIKFAELVRNKEQYCSEFHRLHEKYYINLIGKERKACGEIQGHAYKSRRHQLKGFMCNYGILK